LPESKALDVVTLDESHFVITNTFVDNVSTVKFYKNGEVVATDTRAGDFSNWDSSHVLLLANEATGDRPWLGEIYMVAIYDRPLSEEEVKQNFDAMQ
jgi:L-rhamnose isomerase